MRASLPANIGKVHLNTLARHASDAELKDSVICDICEHQFSTIFGVIPDALAVLRAAATFEPDQARLLEWFVSERIASLGELSAASLVSIGRATEVLSFLEKVESAERITSASYSYKRWES